MSEIFRPRGGGGEGVGPAQHHWQEPTAYGFLHGFRALAQSGLHVSEYRTLCALIGHMTWHNEVNVTQHTLVADTGLHLATVYRALERLVASGWIQPIPRTGGGGVGYRLSPVLLWQGRPHHRSWGLKNYQAQQQLTDGAGLPIPRSVEEASHPPDGTSKVGAAPYPPYYPLDEMSSP